MDTNQAADAIGVTPKHLRRFLRRATAGLGYPPNDHERYEFTEDQVKELRLAYWMSTRRGEDDADG